jgi:hypothetical protein
MPRKVFFSFHYDDVTRANVVRNSDIITRQYQTGIRFYDKSLWEEAKKQGPLAIKRMINGALNGSSVTCVLIGQQTWQRPWVRYEILKSLSRGNGILGVQIHDVGFSSGAVGLGGLFAPKPQMAGGLLGLGALPAQPPAPPSPGPNPLRYLGYTIDRARGTVAFHEVGPNNQWRQSEHVDAVRLTDLPWISGKNDSDNLANMFPVYGWKSQNGAQNFPTWIEGAARQVGR